MGRHKLKVQLSFTGVFYVKAFSFQDNPIALDWVNDNVYWIDKDPEARHIAVHSLNNHKAKENLVQRFTRIVADLSSPVAIAVSPKYGLVNSYYWLAVVAVSFDLL